MSVMVGADVAALRGLGVTLVREAGRLRAARSELTAALARSAWRGRDADAFRQAWTERVAVRLAETADRLHEAGTDARQQADEQERASDSGGAWAGAAPKPGDARTGRDPGQAVSPDDPDAPTSGNGYQIGPPRTPALTWDEDFVYDSQDPTWGDRVEYATWRAKGLGGSLLFEDGGAFYLHYMNNSGDPYDYDLGEGYSEDDGVRASVNAQVAATAQGVDELARTSGQQQFTVTGPASPNAQYPTTENWQKAIGGHQQWSSAAVTVEGDRVTMVVTVHAEDRYNFNRGQADIGSGTPDDVNGRFTEVGLAQPFDSTGTMTRTLSWTLGDPPGADVVNDTMEGR